MATTITPVPAQQRRQPRQQPDEQVQAIGRILALGVIRWHRRKRLPKPGPETAPCVPDRLPPLSDA